MTTTKRLTPKQFNFLFIPNKCEMEEKNAQIKREIKQNDKNSKRLP